MLDSVYETAVIVGLRNTYEKGKSKSKLSMLPMEQQGYNAARLGRKLTGEYCYLCH